jgi:hypothetical protein
LYNTTLTGDEHLELSAMHAIGAMNLMFHLVQAVAPRLLKFDTSSSFDMSLKSLIDSHIDLGWGLFANELEAIDKIFLAVPSMRDLSVPDGLTRISELEITYKALEQKCLDYVRKIDPDRLIMLRLYNDHYASKILEKINIAEKRSFNKFKNLLPGTDVIKKPLEDLLKNR